MNANNTPKNGNRKKLFTAIGSALLVIGVVSGLIYWKYASTRIYIEKAEINAPLIQLASSNAGILQEVMVKEGDEVSANTVVARVDNNLVKSDVAGIVVSVNTNIGKRFNPGEAVVTMIDPTQLRVDGRLQEDKGLSDVRIGQTVVFTVDAFGSKKFYGVVDEVSPTSRASGVVFSISDQRESKEFDIKARFNIKNYSDLKNGMSARMWIIK